MKKRMLYAGVVLLFVILLGYNCRHYITEIPSRFAKYHHTGKITVVADGERINLNGIELDYVYETGEVVESFVLNNGEFKFKKGIYGPNYFSFKIPNENIGEIKIEFGHFNTNWWHVCVYDVQVEIVSQNDGTVYAEIKTTMDIEGHGDVRKISKIMTIDDNKISFFTGP